MNDFGINNQSALTLGKIILAEYDDDFFRETIRDLIMKIKLTYVDLDQYNKLTCRWAQLSKDLQDMQLALRAAHQENNVEEYEKIHWNIQITDELQREVYADMRREERKIEQQIANRRKSLVK